MEAAAEAWAEESDEFKAELEAEQEAEYLTWGERLLLYLAWQARCLILFIYFNIYCFLFTQDFCITRGSYMSSSADPFKILLMVVQGSDPC